MSSVSITMNKNEYDRQLFSKNGKTMTIGKWLIENVGGPFWGIEGFEDGVWNKKLSYDGNDIILTYNFKNHKDAVMFALRWT